MLVANSTFSVGGRANFGLVFSWSYNVELCVSADAHDFYNRGGFAGQEMLLKANIEKLGLELDKLAKDLTPEHLASAEKIASIGAAIMSAIGYFH
ncbi:hypothetical protein [uncultured Alistipes sp.]|uniref:hypothetical protein n=1 Tax=uncultured Alistipes sp. TaxID=538949 RepID=UPI002620F253|nr:hypothetical protein [uncultured Alistipes sp.]